VALRVHLTGVVIMALGQAALRLKAVQGLLQADLAALYL
jgi:hypothetical protein